MAKRKLSEDEFKKLLATEIGNGLTYIDSTISVRRERNAAYYALDMDKYLPALKGQSSVVDGTVASQIGMMMPSLMRIMTGGPFIATYNASGLEDEQAAKDATEYVNNVVMRLDNNGEDIIYKWGWDGLLQVTGIVKAYWEDDIQTSDENYANMSDDEFAMLVQKVATDSRFEITAYEETIELGEMQVPGPDGQPQVIATEVRKHSCTVTKTTNRSKVCVENIPPEEFVISRDARTLEDAVLKSHRTSKTVGDLIEMGYDPKLVETLPGSSILEVERERSQRTYDFPGDRADSVDPMMREVAVHQGIIRCNYDGKGVRDWYFVAAGDENVTEVLEVEPYDYQIVFADFCSDPIPHTFFGRCTGDNLIEPQKVKTAVLRQTLQNLYLANTPVTKVNTSAVVKGTLEALTQRVPGGIIPLNGDPSTSIVEAATPFFAQYSLPMLEYFDMESEKRSGVSRASMGLDPDVLQNQSATAANIAQSASMGRLEMIARIWANGGMRKLFRGILRILKRYQDFSRAVRVKNDVKQVDPRQWADFEDWDCTVQTGLGTGSRDRDMQMLGFIAQIQQQLLTQAGPSNGLVTLGQYGQTIKKMIESAGLQDPEKYVTEIPINYMPPPNPPQPTPDAMVLAQVENEKLKQKQAEAMAKIAADERIKMAELQSKQALAMAELQVKANIEAAKAGVDAEKIKLDYAKLGLDALKADTDAAIKANKEGREDARATIDFTSSTIENAAKQTVEMSAKQMAMMAERQDKKLEELAKLIKAPRKTKIVRGPNGRATESVQELMT